MEIWQEILKDSENGAKRLVTEYGNKMYAVAILLCANKEDAEELAFRTLNQAIRKIKTFDPEHNFYTWLYAIMRNFRKMDLRKKRTKIIAMGSTSDLPEVANDEFAKTLEGSCDDNLLAAMNSLSSQLREVVILHYYENKAIDEVASILQIPSGTVKSRLHNARSALNAFLKNRGGKP